ncbi:MAG: hypothetical protein NZ811_05210 [Gammaproteobacteria bacterium]|nr:hypothetical protein [Gammaproteobacteria bacterium]
MIDVNSVVHLNIKPAYKRLITYTLVVFVTIVVLSLIWIISTEKTIGEDWLLTLVAVLPSIALISAAWFYVLLAKNSLNSEELLEQTFHILSAEVPESLERRLVYYTKMYDGTEHSDSFFNKAGENKGSLLNSDYLKEQMDGYFLIKSNAILGSTSCQYKISGDIVKDYPLVAQLTIGLQINIYQVEATYTFDNLTKSQIEKLVKHKKIVHTLKGAESAGYIVRTTEFDNGVKFKARMDFRGEDRNVDANLLLDSCDKQFFVQDFSLMCGSLISQLKNMKL